MREPGKIAAVVRVMVRAAEKAPAKELVIDIVEMGVNLLERSITAGLVKLAGTHALGMARPSCFSRQ